MREKWVFRKRIPPWWRVWVLLGLVLASIWVVGGSEATAQENDIDTYSLPDIDPFTALVTRRGPSAVRLSSRAPQLYRTAEGDLTFSFQVTGQTALLRFHCDPGDLTIECLMADEDGEEIHLLQASRSPRGDITYRDENGDPVLRVTATGGATLYSDDGAPAVPFANNLQVPVGGGQAVLPIPGESDEVEPPAFDGPGVTERLRRAAELMAAEHGFYITFTAATPKTGDQTVLADTVLTTAKAIDRVAADTLGERAINERLRMVVFATGAGPALSFEGGALTVYFDAGQGVAGRPSSAQIAAYLESVL